MRWVRCSGASLRGCAAGHIVESTYAGTHFRAGAQGWVWSDRHVALATRGPGGSLIGAQASPWQRP
jgi:hypothetical protein